MKIEISDFDCLTDDREGRSRFVLFFKDKVLLPYNTVRKADLWVSQLGQSFRCEVYQPNPNGILDPPHLHMRANREFRLKDAIAVGDEVTIG